jgi:hypothetical protein
LYRQKYKNLQNQRAYPFQTIGHFDIGNWFMKIMLRNTLMIKWLDFCKFLNRGNSGIISQKHIAPPAPKQTGQYPKH